MQKRWLPLGLGVLVLGTLISSHTLPVADAQFSRQPGLDMNSCETPRTQVLVGQSPGEGGQIIAYGPYSTRCANKFHLGVLNVVQGSNVDLQLQRLVNGGWRAVANSHQIRYLADGKPSEWRWIVTTLGKEPSTYRLEIVHPL